MSPWKSSLVFLPHSMKVSVHTRHPYWPASPSSKRYCIVISQEESQIYKYHWRIIMVRGHVVKTSTAHVYTMQGLHVERRGETFHWLSWSEEVGCTPAFLINRGEREVLHQTHLAHLHPQSVLDQHSQYTARQLHPTQTTAILFCDNAAHFLSRNANDI